MPTSNDTIPDGYKRCSKGVDCVHPDGAILPATLEYFSSAGDGKGSLRSRCKACCAKQWAKNYADPEFAAARRKYAAERWRNNPEAKERNRQYKQKPEVKERDREHARNQRQKPGYDEKKYEWQEKRRKDPIKHARDLQYLRDRHKDPEFRRKKREYEQRPDVRKNNSERLRKRREKPEFVEYLREYSQRPTVKVKARLYAQNRRTRVHRLPNTFTLNDYNYTLEYFHGCCAVCGRQLNDLFGEHTVAMDHWIPIVSPECPGTVPENMLPLCHQIGGCNNSKGAKDPLEWLEWKFGKRKAAQINTRIQAFFATVRR